MLRLSGRPCGQSPLRSSIRSCVHEIPPALGATPTPDGTRFAVWSGIRHRLWLCLFDGERETRVRPRPRRRRRLVGDRPRRRPRHPLRLPRRRPLRPRARPPVRPREAPRRPLRLALDRPFAYNPRLAAPRDAGIDTAPLMPKAIVTALRRRRRPQPPVFRPGGLIYEVPVRPFTILHPEVPERDPRHRRRPRPPGGPRPPTRLGVDAVELMPIAAWIDERHLAAPRPRPTAGATTPSSSWPPTPASAPAASPELAATVAALRAAGIGTLLDVVFNHTGESDAFGPTLSLRGLDNAAYFRHAPDGTPRQRRRHRQHPRLRPPRDPPPDPRQPAHFVAQAGVDGFRFDLAPILGRTATASTRTPRSSPRSPPTPSSPPG